MIIVANWRFLKIKKSLIFVFLFLIQIFSSGYFAQKYLYFSERRFVFPKVAVIEKLQEIAGINRIWGYGNAYIENNLVNYFNLLSPEGYDALFSRRYGQLLYLSETNGRFTSQIGRCDANIKPASEREAVLDNWYRQRLFSLLGVKYIIESKAGEGKDWLSQEKRFPPAFFRLVWEDPKFRIWEYLEVLPRAFFATDYLVAKDDQQIIERLFDPKFELGKKIILEKNPGLNKENDIYKDEQLAGVVEFEKYLPNQVWLRVTAPFSGLLFLSDNYSPGWKAFLDGEEVEILRANFSFRAVKIPQGEHRLVFVYRPSAFYWGLKTSVFSLGLFILLIGGWQLRLKLKDRLIN